MNYNNLLYGNGNGDTEYWHLDHIHIYFQYTNNKMDLFSHDGLIWTDNNGIGFCYEDEDYAGLRTWKR